MTSETVRLDRWLCAARILKSRALATAACTGGHVSCNDTKAKPHHALRPGDRVEVRLPHGLRVLEVLELEEKRQSASRARELYLDHSPPPPPRDPRGERAPLRERGAGRPTKRDRRTLRRIRGR